MSVESNKAVALRCVREVLERRKSSRSHHHVVFGPDSRWATRAGVVDVFDREVDWNAMVVLRFQDGKIAEEWVVRDELQVLLQAGVVSSPLTRG